MEHGEILKDHLIPANARLDLSDFADFYEKRKALLRGRLRDIISQWKASRPYAMQDHTTSTMNNDISNKNTDDDCHVAIWVIVAVFIMVMGIAIGRMISDRPRLTEIKFQVCFPTDSVPIGESSDQQRMVLDSISQVIARQEKELNYNYELFMKARNDDADMLKIISCIGGFLIAMLAVFGVKNIKDLKDNIYQKVTEEAKEIAQNATRKKLNAIVKGVVEDHMNESQSKERLVGEAVSKAIDKINKDSLIQLEGRISDLERISQVDAETHGRESTEGNANTDIAADIDAPFPGDDILNGTGNNNG